MLRESSVFMRCFEFVEERVVARDYKLTLVELRDRFFPSTVSIGLVRMRLIAWMKDKPFCWGDWILLPQKAAYDKFSVLLDELETQRLKISPGVISAKLGCDISIVEKLLKGPLGKRYHMIPPKQKVETVPDRESKTKAPEKPGRTPPKNSVTEKIRSVILAELTLYDLGTIEVVSRQARLARHFGVSNELARIAVNRLPQDIKERYEKAPKTQMLSSNHNLRIDPTNVKELVHSLILRDVRDFWHNRIDVVIEAKQIRRELADCPKSIASCLPLTVAKQWRLIVCWQAHNSQLTNRKIAQLARKEVLAHLRGEKVYFTSRKKIAEIYRIPIMNVSRILRHTLSISLYRLHATQCRKQ